MRWQKTARLLIALIGLGTAVAIVVLTRARPTVTQAVPTTGGDPNATFQSGAGLDVRHEGSRLVARSEYSQIRRYPDRVEWDDFVLTLEGGERLSARRVTGTFSGESREEPSAFAFDGGVRFEGADGATLEGEAGRYDQATGMATIPGVAVIARGRMTGRGTGGVYERSTGAFKLIADARMTIAPVEGGDPIEASAVTMTVVGAGRTVLLEEQARIARTTETMSADRATIYLSEDQQQFESIDLRGRARVQPVPGAAAKIPDLQGDAIELGFHIGPGSLERGALHRQARMVQVTDRGSRSVSAGEIVFRMAQDGQTLTRLEATDRVSVQLPPSAEHAARTITAAKLVASGTERAGLTSAVFDGNAEFIETVTASRGRPAGRRTGRAQRLSLAVQGDLDAIESALFERDVRFTSRDVTGTADVGNYRAGDSTLELRPLPGGPGRRARVEDEGVIVEAAERIVIDLDSNDLQARRGVTTVSRAGGREGGAAAIFDAGQPTYGSAAEFWYDAAAERFRYMGDEKTRAQLKQSEDSVVFGREIVFHRTSQELSATGQAESVFAIAQGPDKTPSRYRATADSLQYDEVSRTVTYRGSSARLTSDSSETQADTILLALAPTTRTLERMDATGAVRATLQAGRQALGERLIYDVAASAYRLWGRPLTLWTRDADGTCSSQSGNFVRFEGDIGAPDFPKAENPAGATLRGKLPCPPFIGEAK